MTTEQYSIGYEEGYQAGWNEAMEAKPEQQQEPVALETVYETIIHWDEGGGKRSRRELAQRIVDLYTSPPANANAGKQWVGLTDEEKAWCGAPTLQETVARVEAKLKEKNNG